MRTVLDYSYRHSLSIYLFIFAMNIIRLVYCIIKKEDNNEMNIVLKSFIPTLIGLFLSYWASSLPTGGGITTEQFESLGLSIIAIFIMPLAVLMLIGSWGKSSN